MSETRMRRRDRIDTRAIVVVVCLCALWGVQQVAVKVSVAGGLPPVFQAGARSLVAALLVCGWIAARGGAGALRQLLRPAGSLWPGLTIAAMFAVEFLLLFPGLKLTTASRGVLFLYTAPFFTALGAHFLLPGERLDPRRLAGLAVAFAGVAVAFADGLMNGRGSLTGDAMCLAGGAIWGATTVVVKVTPSLARAPAAKVLLWQLGGSAPLLLLVSAALGELDVWPDATAIAWAGLFYQTFVVAFASYLAWFWLVLIYPARIASFTFLTPVFGILAGAILLGEHASPALGVGLAAIAIGLRLVNARGRAES